MSLLKTWLMIFSLLVLSCSQPSIYSFMINYSHQVVISEETDLIIVSPYATIQGDKINAYAYLSLTEINQYSPYFNQLPKEAFIQENQPWSSFLVDIMHPAWQHIIAQELLFILKQGFRHVFIDTADGVEKLCGFYPTDCSSYKNQAKKILTFIQTRIAKTGHIIINRGFVIYPDVKAMLKGVLIESFFYDKNQLGQFVRRNHQAMTWLSEWVKRLKQDNKLILAVDYAENISEPEQQFLQEKAEKMGISWVLAHESLQ